MYIIMWSWINGPSGGF